MQHPRLSHSESVGVAGHRLITDDCGFLDEAGYLHVTDRKKDMIVWGGLNVYSKEVESYLLAHPDGRRRSWDGRTRRGAKRCAPECIGALFDAVTWIRENVDFRAQLGE